MTRPRRSTLVIAVLALALVASNVYWLVLLLDAGITATYRDVSLQDNQEALRQALAVTPVAVRTDATREDVLRAARAAGPDDLSEFEKDGYTWVHRIGLRFDSEGRLAEVRPAWD